MEGADYGNEVMIVCVRVQGRPLLYADNRVGTCHFCEEEVQCRPHQPQGLMICTECFMERVEPGDLLQVTQETVEEVREIIKKKMN